MSRLVQDRGSTTRMGRRLGLGVGGPAAAESMAGDGAAQLSCTAIGRGVGGRVLRTRTGALALLLLLLALEGWRLWQPEGPPECECESQQCFLHHKESALRGAVARARRKYTPKIQELEQQLAALRAANQTKPAHIATPAAVSAAIPGRIPAPSAPSTPSSVAAVSAAALSAGQIPRILHQTWKTSSIPPELQKYLLQLINTDIQQTPQIFWV